MNQAEHEAAGVGEVHHRLRKSESDADEVVAVDAEAIQQLDMDSVRACKHGELSNNFARVQDEG